MMKIEIERKFLVEGEFKADAHKQIRITQGYLSSASQSTVRVRVADDKGFLTIKGATNNTGLSRVEWEKEIPGDEALQLLSLCESGTIDKTRYLVNYRGHIFEVDEFYGHNQGLIIAEIELQDEEESFEKPQWLGKEVTGDKRYSNSQLLINPFPLWKNNK